MNAYTKYLTAREREKIRNIEMKILTATSLKEVELYQEQIGLIFERIIIRKQFEEHSKKL